MLELPIPKRKILSPLFGYTDESMVDSCLGGHMGRAWADSDTAPSAARILVGGFCLLAGDSASPAARDLACRLPEDYSLPYLLIAPEHEGWARLVEASWKRWRRIQRYAIRKEGMAFDPVKLQGYADALPAPYRLERMDGRRYREAMAQEEFRDFCANFDSEQDYLRRGLGFCATLEDRIVGGASSFSVFANGIEIEIDTHPEHRRRGIALACGARLILECLATGLTPSWDAANLASVALAERLGYQPAEPYPAYSIDYTGGTL